jgi:hypothetical protein
MNESIDNSQWFQYLETPCRKRTPVKLEYVLAQRIETFMKAKKVKSARSVGVKRERN